MYSIKKPDNFYFIRYGHLLITLLFATALSSIVQAAIKTSAGTGNWSSASTWSPSGVPASTDDVVIHGGNIVTVDGSYTCRNLNIGDATNSNVTLQVNSTKSLTVTGDLQINPNGKNKIYTLDAGAGNIYINGTFSTWSNTGTDNIKVGTGTISFIPAVSISGANQNITFTGAGTVNFYNSFTDSYNQLVTFASCTVNFSKSYTVNTTAANWAGKGTAVFKGTGYSITPTSNLTFFNVKFDSTTTLASAAGAVVIGGDLTISSGASFSSSQNFQIKGNWINNGGTFTSGSTTVTFNSTTANQSIQGNASTENFNNVSISKTGNTLSVVGNIRTININGTLTLSSGTFDAGTATSINMTAGSWTNNGGTFTPSGSTINFSGTGAQSINGTALSQTFNKLTVNKGSNTLTVGGSTTSLTLNSNLTLSAGTFDKGTAVDIYAGGNWTNNGGTFIYGTGTVTFNGSTAQAINGSTSVQTFYNLKVNKTVDTLSISGSTSSVVINNALTFTSGLIKTGSAKVSIPTTGSIIGAGAGKYIYGNEEMYIPNSTGPSRTFTIGDASAYAPVTITFSGSTSGSGSITASTSAGDDADIVNSGINSSKSINRIWNLSNSGVGGFTSYAPTFTFIASDKDATANTANFEIRRFTSGTWQTTTAGSRTATTTQATGETLFGRIQIGEKNSITVNSHPSNSSVCSRSNTNFISSSASSPAPSKKWQRDANTGTYVDVNDTLDAGVYSNFTTDTLQISDVTGLDNYKYRTVFTNINGSAISTQATLTTILTPTITNTSPAVNCSTGIASLGATASVGSVRWYASSSGGSILHIGTSFTTPVLSSTTTYYADAANGSCATNQRTAVTAVISSTPTASVAYQSCAGTDGNTTIRIGHTNGTSPFTYSINGSAYHTYDTVHIANGSNQNYYVKDTFGCTSSPVNYTATSAIPLQIAGNGSATTCSCASAGEGRELYLTNASGELIAIINDKGHNLGTITATVYAKPSPVLITNNQGGLDAALSRNFVLDFNGTGLTPAVEVKFPFTNTELGALTNAAANTPIMSDDINTIADLGSTQYEGPDEDDTYNTTNATMLVYHRQLGNGSILGGKYITIGLSANGEHWLHGNNTNGSPLPVELVSFEAEAKADTKTIQTKWSTALEINNAYFTLERSINGTDFNEIGRVNGAGNHTGMLEYAFEDVNPLAGVSYYRLKQTDFDGNFSYSAIVAVTMSAQSSFLLYPNPAQREINIQVVDFSEQIQVLIYDLNGREMFSRIYQGEKTEARMLINLPIKDFLSPGIYIVDVITNGITAKQKLMVNN